MSSADVDCEMMSVHTSVVFRFFERPIGASGISLMTTFPSLATYSQALCGVARTGVMFGWKPSMSNLALSRVTNRFSQTQNAW